MENSGCFVCAPEWKFKYIQWAARNDVSNKYDNPNFINLIDIKNEDQITEDLKNKLNGFDGRVLYRDSNIFIFEDSDKDSQSHLLICPSRHISIDEAIANHEVLVNLYSAADILVKLANVSESTLMLKSVTGFSIKKDLSYYSVDHAHMHFRADGLFDFNAVRDKIKPEFYKESVYYKKWESVTRPKCDLCNMYFEAEIFWDWHKVEGHVVMCRNGNGK